MNDIPEAKRYVLDSLEICRRVVDSPGGDGTLEIAREKVRAAAAQLNGLQEKVFLKTKRALNSAFAVLESATAVQEALESWQQAVEADKSDAVEEITDAVAEFATGVGTLESASKKQSIIIT